MKITEQPIPQAPPPVTYVLELSFEELVTLGVLSHRHELKEARATAIFYEFLPDLVREEAGRRATSLNRLVRPGGQTYNSVNWRTKP